MLSRGDNLMLLLVSWRSARSRLVLCLELLSACPLRNLSLVVGLHDHGVVVKCLVIGDLVVHCQCALWLDYCY